VNGDELSSRQAAQLPSGAACASDWAPSLRRRWQGGALVVAVAGAGLWLTAATWPAAAPFAIGGIIAYLLLPLVDRLDRIMPRSLAAIIAVLAVVGVIGAVLVIVLPPLAGAFVRFAAELPTSQQIQDALTRWQAGAGSLPEGSQVIVVPAVEALSGAVRAALLTPRAVSSGWPARSSRCCSIR
jgi:predicted PurR-regulated permease PerM